MTSAVDLSLKRQPRALYLLAAVQMWEFFSFYGMRALLVLYMSSQLKFDDYRAVGIFAVYTGLVELGGIVGGIIADRILGLRKAISLGGWLIAVGHIVMAFQSSESYLFVGLAFIVVGSSLFSTNITALLGQYYGSNDQRREEGYTLFYVGNNLGALLASILCGAVGEYYGWHYGFSLAAIGMLIGNIALYFFRSVLEDKGLPPSQVSTKKLLVIVPLMLLAVGGLSLGIAQASILLHLLPWVSIACAGIVMRRLIIANVITKRTLVILGVSLAALALFYASEEQIGSSFMLFNERFSSGTVLGIAIPATVLLSLNPITILIIGPFINKICNFFKRSKSEQGNAIATRMIVAYVMVAMAFGGLAFLCVYCASKGIVPMSGLMISVIIISIAELLVGPTVYSIFSEIAPEGEQGVVMGLVPLGFSLSSFLGGHLSQLMAMPEETALQSIGIYSIGFGIIGGLLIIMALFLAIIVPLIIRKLSVKKLEVAL